MRFVLTLSATALMATVLQTAILSELPLPAVPDLLLGLVVWLGLYDRGARGAVLAFVLGYLTDTFSGTVLGLHTFAMTATYVASVVLSRTIYTEGALSTLAVVFIGGCVREFALAVAGLLTGEPGALWHHFLAHGAMNAMMAAVVAPLSFSILRTQERWFARVG